MKQTTLGSTDWALKTKVTRRAQFLSEMEAVVPWARLLAVIDDEIRAIADVRSVESFTYFGIHTHRFVWGTR